MLFADGQVKLMSYDASAAGIVQSFVDRFPSTDVDTVIQQLWEKDQHHF
jgi:dipeptidyl-peptidase-3